MSWSYSRPLVEEYSAVCCSDTELYAQLNMTPMPDQFYWPDKTTEHSRLSRFGMTCEPLTEGHGAELLMWFLEVSHARTSVSPETEPDWTAKGQGYGEKWRGSLGKYDPVSCSLKTAQLSLLEDLTACCVTLPRWGLMLDGELYPQPMLELRTGGKESGFWQTPVADDCVNREKGKWNSRGEPKLSAQVMFPTPTASDHTGAGHKAQGGKNLRTVVSEMMWPTPTVCGNNNRKGVSKTSGDGLATAVKNLPTPSASDGTRGGRMTENMTGQSLVQMVNTRIWPTATATAYKGWSPKHNRAESDDRLDYTVERESFTDGQQTPPMRLNPDWVEWLMGWPIGQTALKPLATAKFREFVQQHGICFMESEESA